MRLRRAGHGHGVAARDVKAQLSELLGQHVNDVCGCRIVTARCEMPSGGPSRRHTVIATADMFAGIGVRSLSLSSGHGAGGLDDTSTAVPLSWPLSLPPRPSKSTDIVETVTASPVRTRHL